MKQLFTISPAPGQDVTQQVLSLRVGERHIGFSISSHPGNELLQLAWYTAEQIGEPELDELYTQHPELHHSFYSTLVSYEHPQSVLMPVNVFPDADAPVLLQTMYGVNGNHAIITEKVNDWSLQNSYAVPRNIQEWISRHFPAGHYRHTYSIGLRQMRDAGGEGTLFVDFRTQDFTVIAIKEGKLLLAQTICYAASADVIYYLVKACTEFSFNRETVALEVSGLVEKESNLYRTLTQYFLQARFREPTWNMQAGEASYPAHFFTSFNDLAVCAL